MDANGKTQPVITGGAVEMGMIRDLQRRVAAIEATVETALAQLPDVIREAVTAVASDLSDRAGLVLVPVDNEPEPVPSGVDHETTAPVESVAATEGV